MADLVQCGQAVTKFQTVLVLTEILESRAV